MTRFTPLIDGERPAVSDLFPGAASVAVAVYNVRDNEILTASSTAAAKLGATDVWSYDLALITGTIPLAGGATLENVFEAELLAVMTPTGGTGSAVTKPITLNGVQKLLAFDVAYGGAINVDIGAGSPGAVPFVNGTLGNPVNNEADAKMLADFFARRKYRLTGDSTLNITVDHEGWTFEGISFLTPVDIKVTASIEGSIFRGIAVDGIFGAIDNIGVVLEDCLVNFAGILFAGFLTLRRCLIGGLITFGVAKFVNALAMTDCTVVDIGFGRNGVDMADSDGLIFAFDQMGEMFLRNASSASGVYIFSLNGGRVIFEATATDGVATLAGVGTFDQQGAISIVLNGLLDQVGAVSKNFLASGGTVSTVFILAEEPAGAFNGLRIRVTDVSGAVTEERIVKTHTKPVAGQDGALLTLESPLSFIPVTGDIVVVRYSPDEGPFVNTLLNQQEYVLDAGGQLLTKSILTKFANEAGAAAADKADTFHAGAIATFESTATPKDGTPGEGKPDQYKLRKIPTPTS
jgi:hypothetical protein